MAAITLQRCLHHAGREAVARCPECSRFFCRECVVEHEQRVICAGCVTRLTAVAKNPPKRVRLGAVLSAAGAWIGIFLTWMVFYFVGRTLLAVPDDFHASTLWKADWMHSDSK